MDMIRETTAIITAAGSGLRLPGTTKKQFRELEGIPILIRALEPFFTSPQIGSIVITSPEDDVLYCQALVQQYFEDALKPYLVVHGGMERQDSVFGALQVVKKDTDFILIHDGVRPLISIELISELLRICEVDQAVVPAARLKNTIKRIEGDYAVETLHRNQLVQVFTPQVFSFPLIMEAYCQAYEDGFVGTDDACLVERLGHKVRYLMGSEQNLKITDELDLFIASKLIEKRMI